MIKTLIHKILGKSQGKTARSGGKPAASQAKSRIPVGKRVEVPAAEHGIDPRLVDERARKVVETLQSNRSETVNLLDQLVRQLPDGMYLKSVRQQGAKVVINGVTQSQARVSTLMRNLESSQKLANPALVEIRALTQGAVRANDFTMNVNIVRPKAEKG